MESAATILIDGLELNSEQRFSFKTFEVCLKKGAFTTIDFQGFSHRTIFIGKENSYNNIIITIYPFEELHYKKQMNHNHRKYYTRYNLGDKLERLLWQTAVGKFMIIDALDDVEFLLYLKGG